TVLRRNPPDSLLLGMLAIVLLLLAITLGRDGLPRLSHWIATTLNQRSVAAILLGSATLAWLGFILAAAIPLNYVGHADYADNAVVARNLLAGRGFVVDYVTQFYQIYAGVTRPQETWPIMQPIWIVPFYAMFGVGPIAAKLPNFLFHALLIVAIYLAGSRLWDRRIGLTAALIILTSHLFFLLVFYVTGDLAFVLFAFAAVALIYRTAGLEQAARRGEAATGGLRTLLAAAIATGLMLLQKPGSGGLIAVGMGLWFLAECRPWRRGEPVDLQVILRRMLPVIVWAALAIAILSPYMLRNMLVFGRPYYSTESKDAWVLEYTEWDRIYAVYAPDGGLSVSGVPDHTWILRWGFDRTFIKIERQIAAIRDYLMPAWPGAPFELGSMLGGRPDKQRLLFEVGAWLSLFGMIGALGYRRRLIGLLLAAYLPYALFLIFYWHTNEERYWVALMPWLAIFAAAALWRGYERIAIIGGGRWTPLGLLLVISAFVCTITPSWPIIADKLDVEPRIYQPDLILYRWLSDETPTDAVMMTRAPWQLNWHTERPAVMIPYTTDPQVVLRLAQHYNARYLVLESLQRPEREVQRMLDAMVADPAFGFREVYRSPTYVIDVRGRQQTTIVHVYAFPADYGGVPPIR
ncbi:MAG TPA: glycosyltransferase family 39 protein, partial [Roseiflexaceae bacterium]|nr:glycosyltransferase family 39 protein [Roseiflexaceae bacterium]